MPPQSQSHRRTFRSGGHIFATVLATLALGATASNAQLPAPPATTEEALHQMSDLAGIIFAGQVTDVRRVESANGAAGILEIDFAVEDAVLGVAPNTTCTLREWAGLTPNGDSTFVIGRRYLMFLHSPGPGGLSSPIGGPDGAIPIISGNEAASPTTPDTAGLAAQAALAQASRPTGTSASNPPRSSAHTSFRPPSMPLEASPTPLAASQLAMSALASSTIDLRWIATRVLTPIAYTSSTSTMALAHPIVAHADFALSSVNLLTSSGEIAGSTAAGSTATTAVPRSTTTTTYANVLAMLRSWQGENHAAR